MQRDLLTERSFAYQVANYEIINNNKANQNQMNDINEHTDLCHHQWYSFSIGKQKKTKVTIKFDHFFFSSCQWRSKVLPKVFFFFLQSQSQALIKVKTKFEIL